MNVYDLITIVWIVWTGVLGISITLISGSKTGRDWSIKKITLMSLALSTIASIVVLYLFL